MTLPDIDRTTPEASTPLPSRAERLSLAPLALGAILIVAAAIDLSELARWAQDDWRLLARGEIELFAGLWLLIGLAPRWTRWGAVAGCAALLVYDLASEPLGLPRRPSPGRLRVAAWLIPGLDIVVLGAFLAWRPSAIGPALIIPRPGRAVGLFAAALAAGLAVAWTQIGYYPIQVAPEPDGSTAVERLGHVVYLPDGYYFSSRRWPLIIDLHGSGAWGRDLGKVRASGLAKQLELGMRIPLIVVSPQCPHYGWDPRALAALLSALIERYRVDRERVYLSGSSMGGYGVWATATAYPERFAAVAPICGGGDPAAAERLRGLPVWAFHGALDDVVPTAETRAMVAALERAGGDVAMTVYPGVGHDAATPTYANPELYRWFLGHRRQARAKSTLGDPLSPRL